MPSPQASESSPWALSGDVAALHYRGLASEVAVTSPFLGLQLGAETGYAAGGQLLQVGAGAQPANDSWEVSDAYVRGDDLSVTYEPCDSRPFRLQASWRLHQEQSNQLRGVVLDVVASVQTRRWEAYPTLTLGSTLRGESAAVVTADGEPSFSRIDAAGDFAGAVEETVNRPFVIRLNRRYSYIETRVNGDFDLWRLEIDQSGNCRSESILRPRFMERGVIRRLRLRVALVPCKDDVATARSLAAQLQQECPPLTT